MLQPLKDSIPNARLVFRRNQESFWQRHEDSVYVAMNGKSYVDYPILYASGSIGFDFPERFTGAFRATVRATMQAGVRQ